MPSNQTTNYQLNQWERTDQVLMEDFNADNAKLDAALTAQAGTLAAHTEALSKLGNCQIYTTSYVGTGEDSASHPNSLTFPRKPALVVIGYNNYFTMRIFPCDASLSWDHTPCELHWNGNTLLWHAANPTYQLNVKDQTYYVIAFWPADE